MRGIPSIKLSQRARADALAFVAEAVGTMLFFFLGLGGVKTALITSNLQQVEESAGLSTETILYISTSMGLALLVTAFVFFRVTGAAFNPAIVLSLFLIGSVSAVRAVLLVIAEIVGAIAGAGLVALFTGNGGVSQTIPTLAPSINAGQGLMLEAFLTSMLVFSVLMLAAEKHLSTHIAPIGIGLVLFSAQLFGTAFTGCSLNPARAFGPSVVSASFQKHHWVYWLGPIIGSLMATGFYMLLKACNYRTVVENIDTAQAATDDTIYLGQKLRQLMNRRKATAEGDAIDLDAALDKLEKGAKLQTKMAAPAMAIDPTHATAYTARTQATMSAVPNANVLGTQEMGAIASPGAFPSILH